MNSMIMDTQKKQTQKLESPEMTAAMTAVNTLVDYAAILAKNGGRDFLPDLRDMVNEMLWLWAPEDAAAGTLQGPTALQKEYHKRINAAVKGHPAELLVSARQAGSIVRGLSIHAEEMGKQGSLLSISSKAISPPTRNSRRQSRPPAPSWKICKSSTTYSKRKSGRPTALPPVWSERASSWSSVSRTPRRR